MYTIYNEGEEWNSFQTLEELKTFVVGLRRDYTADEEQQKVDYPTDFDENYQPGDGFDDYFRDVYEVKQDVDVEQFLK